MAPKGEDGSWLRNATEERKGLDSISVRISSMEVKGAFKRQQSGGESDGEDYIGCFPRGRKVYSDSANLKGAPFARLDAHQDAESVRARVLGAICCCCGQPGYSGEGEDAGLQKSGGGSKQEAVGSRRWDDVDLSGGCCKAPYWKQLARRAKAHVHVRQAPHPSRGDWLNYDPHSYQMNFDDGCRREDGVSSLYIDENDDPASRERAMQSALLKKFAASRAQSRVGV
ncbi:hypothetical protein M758_11G079300 [Ceratodon purpureus]|nr:hypothetical protein M758_11G079300 [Ceratodon purpureus]